MIYRQYVTGRNKIVHFGSNPAEKIVRERGESEMLPNRGRGLMEANDTLQGVIVYLWR